MATPSECEVPDCAYPGVTWSEVLMRDDRTMKLCPVHAEFMAKHRLTRYWL